MQSKYYKSGGLNGPYKVIVMMGPPGSGKGTQSAKIVREFGYKHISTGDLLREEAKADGCEGEELRRVHSLGRPVPNQLIVAILIKTMILNPAKCYLLDDFPRTLE